MELFCFTLNMSSGINLNDLGTKPLFTLVCLSIHKPHQFCLFETYIGFSCEWGSWWWIFSFSDLPSLTSREVGKHSPPRVICLDSQPRSMLYLNWKREGRGEESDSFAILPGKRKTDQSTRHNCYSVTFNP